MELSGPDASPRLIIDLRGGVGPEQPQPGKTLSLNPNRRNEAFQLNRAMFSAVFGLSTDRGLVLSQTLRRTDPTNPHPAEPPACLPDPAAESVFTLCFLTSDSLHLVRLSAKSSAHFFLTFYIFKRLTFYYKYILR